MFPSLAFAVRSSSRQPSLEGRLIRSGPEIRASRAMDEFAERVENGMSAWFINVELLLAIACWCSGVFDLSRRYL